MWDDVHHLRHVEHQGTTDPENCLLLCSFHHGLHHQGDWRVDYDPPDDQVTVRDPAGRIHGGEQHWRGHRRRTDPDRARALVRVYELKR